MGLTEAHENATQAAWDALERWEGAAGATRAYLAAMGAAGYVLAPKEATRAMLLAADRHSGVTAQDYRDMIAARPRLENE